MDRSAPDQKSFRAAADALLDVTFDALHGNAAHASRLFSDSIDPNVEVDFPRELAAFWTRTASDLARAIQVAQEVVTSLGSTPPAAPEQPMATSGPAAAASTGPIFCDDRQSFGPFRSPGAVQPLTLRRRGDPQPSITGGRITVTPASVTRNPTDLQIKVECGGMPRGIYEGVLRVGQDDYPYHIYLDPQ